MTPTLEQRRAGILLHPTSLPGRSDNGDLGHEAYRFVDFLNASGFSVWQMLPLGPTHDDRSPYQCRSVHAGNPLLISLNWLKDRGWLERLPDERRFESPADARMYALREAGAAFASAGGNEHETAYADFVREQADWLHDYALYIALHQENGGKSWTQWDIPLRDRDPGALDEARSRLAKQVEQTKFEQYVFFQQWRELRDYAHRHNVLLFGDMPIFVAHDSADVWAQRQYFDLDDQGRARYVAGVPPDYFAEHGQLWGNPHYDWEYMQADGFRWWVQRLQTQLALFDFVRIDHFRGFEACWQIPADAITAEHGHWAQTPGAELLRKLKDTLGSLPLVAEDLGMITPEVDALRDAFQLPGMKILQFAFDGSPDNPYLPHNHVRNSIVYTGTHDNDTTLSWYESLPEEHQSRIQEYLGFSAETMPWPLLRCVLASVANLAMLPMQDILGLGAGHRMNTPGTTEGNWQWRFSREQMNDELSQRLARLTELYQRQPDSSSPPK